MKIRILSALSVLVVAPVFAQLAAPNAAGVSAGHMHINASDLDAQKRFWTQVGGTLVQHDKLTMVQFPGIYVLLRQQKYSGPSVGSSINHFGLHVKDFDASVAKWRGLGMAWEVGNNPGQGFLTGPDGVRLEIIEQKDQATPLAMHHIHLFVPDPKAAQAWYDEHFGATAGKRGQFETSNVPGTEITFTKSEGNVPSDGRSIDHMGFEIHGIDAFVAKLQADGIKTDGAIRNSANASGLRIVYVTDPWGTKIELTEGLAPPATSASR